MPIPLALGAAAISGGSQLLSNLFNIRNTNRLNDKQQSFNLKMYDRQRADALADWNMQNVYNSPSQQMQRFKEAGLNPNLIYGQMTNSPVIRSTDMKSPDFVAPKLDTNIGSNALMSYYNIKGTEAQIKQQEASTQLIQEQARGKKLENENLIDASPYLLEEKLQSSRLKGKQVDSLIQEIDNKQQLNPLLRDKLKQDIQSMAQTRMWQNLTTPQQIAITKATEALINAKLEGQNLENTYKKYQNDLQTNMGINTNLFGDLIKIGVGSLLNK
jgi:ribosomal protein S13